MIYFEQRNGKSWTSSSTKDVGPGSYQVKQNHKKETHNHGTVPFGVCSERFKSELAMKFEALPGPGHYESLSISQKRPSQARSTKSYTGRNKSRDASRMILPETNEISLMTTADNMSNRPVMLSSERAITVVSQPQYDSKKRLLKPRKVKSDYGKTVNSIPFKREEDNIKGVGPGAYNPNIETIHK